MRCSKDSCSYRNSLYSPHFLYNARPLPLVFIWEQPVGVASKPEPEMAILGIPVQTDFIHVGGPGALCFYADAHTNRHLGPYCLSWMELHPLIPCNWQHYRQNSRCPAVRALLQAHEEHTGNISQGTKIHTRSSETETPFLSFLFRNLLSALVTLTTCEECDPLCVKSMFRMC